MTYQFYLLLHFIGIFLVLSALSGVAVHVIGGGSKEFSSRKWLAMVHGIGLVLAFVAGFGLLAKLGLSRQIPSWALMKMVIWLILGAMPAFFYRKPQLARSFYVFMLVLAVVAASLAVYKPGQSGSQLPVTAPQMPASPAGN